MRTFYIALIFIGCLSLAIAADAPKVFEPVTKPAAVNCTAATPVTGCTECQGTAPSFSCKTADVGYYIDVNNQAKNCPDACTECQADTTAAKLPICTKCQATDGFVEYSATNPTVSGCILCKDGFTFDNGNTNALQATNQDGICISVAADGKFLCKTNYFWNSLPTATRQCVIKTANCATGYKNAAGAIASQNCDQCADKYSIVASSSQNGNKIYYGTQNCLQQITLPTRPAPVPCKNATDTTATGCATCGGPNQCTTASPGYFIPAARLRNLATEPNAEVLVQACQPQCNECNDAKTCKSCDTNAGYVGTVDVKTGYCSCDVTKGYTSSIPYGNVKIGVAISYNCVSQTAGQACSTGYVFGSAPIYPLQATIPSCLDPKDTEDCFTDPRTGLTTKSQYSVTSLWNQSPNPSRTCVPAFSGKCGSGYRTESGQTESATDKPLDGDCIECIAGYISSGTEGNMICNKNASSILAMSIAFLGLLLALVF